MTGSFWWDLLITVTGGLLLAWLALVLVLAMARPRGGLLREALRILPDVLRLVHRLAADPTLPRGVRIQLGLLLAYLALPIDLIPDFIPILGYADDAILVTAVLRSVVRRASLDAVREHWPGTPDGFTALIRLTGLTTGATPSRFRRCRPALALGARDRPGAELGGTGFPDVVAGLADQDHAGRGLDARQAGSIAIGWGAHGRHPGQRLGSWQSRHRPPSRSSHWRSERVRCRRQLRQITGPSRTWPG